MFKANVIYILEPLTIAPHKFKYALFARVSIVECISMQSFWVGVLGGIVFSSVYCESFGQQIAPPPIYTIKCWPV